MGASICQHLARQGLRVAVLDLDGEAAEKQAESLRSAGAEVVAVQLDVADRTAVEGAFERVRAALGPIEILVTSAAVAGFLRFEEVTAEVWARTLAVNLTGTFHCIQAAIPDMLAAGWGRVVTLSSAAGQSGSLRQTHYSALALEYAAAGITVNSVAPFAVDTPLLRAAQDAGQLPKTEVVSRMIPAGRLGTPDDVAATCAFLCSDAAGYITAQVIAPNGGAVR